MTTAKLIDPGTESAVRAFLEKVTGRYDLSRAILFGSRARRGSFLAMTLFAAICAVAAQPALGGPPDRYRYQLEVGQDMDVCRHVTDVFNERFQTPWDKEWLRPEPMPTFQGVRYDKIFERLPGVAFDKRFTFDLLLSKYPSSTEFDAVLWKESRMDFGQGAIGPVLIAKLDIDNDGRMDWVVKDGVMSIPPRDEGRNAGGSESLAIFSEDAFDPLAPLHLSQLAEGQRGMNPPRLMYRHETWQFRPFIYQNRVYVSAYEASWAPEPLDAKTSIRIFPDEEFMTVQSVATDVTRDGQLLRAVADEICRVRMLMQDQGRAN